MNLFSPRPNYIQCLLALIQVNLFMFILLTYYQYVDECYTFFDRCQSSACWYETCSINNQKYFINRKHAIPFPFLKAMHYPFSFFCFQFLSELIKRYTKKSNFKNVQFSLAKTLIWNINCIINCITCQLCFTSKNKMKLRFSRI